MSCPLVAVVSPIYQGSSHVEACVESVRAQSYENWIHLLVDNKSSDGTQEVAARLESEDSRVRLIRCDEHVGMLANWNRALSLIPKEAVYVRQLNVDDRLEPSCLERSVAAAEAHPEAALVSSYFLSGKRRLPKVQHSSVTVLSGREVVRRLFQGEGDYLAQPSVLLLRLTAIKGWPCLYAPDGFPPGLPSNPPLCQADKEGFFETLAAADLVFVPEQLVSLREDADSATGYSWRVGAWHAGWMELLMRHGEDFLEPDEVSRAMRRFVFKYVRSSAWRSLKGKTLLDSEFAEFHRYSLRYLIPALRARGFLREAKVLGLFARLVGARAQGETASDLQELGASNAPRAGE